MLLKNYLSVDCLDYLLLYLTNEKKGSGMTLPKSKTSKSGFRTMTKAHVNEALTAYLQSLSLINDDEEVTNFNKAPDSLDVKIEKV